MSTPLRFLAEVKEVKARKTASLDVEYTLKVVSDDPLILSLGNLKPDALLEITCVEHKP